SQGSSLSILTEPHAELAPFHTRSPRRRYSRNETLWNASLSLLRLDPCELHHLAPLLRFFGDEPSKADRRHRHRYATQIGHPCLQLRIGQARVDLLVERLDDLSRRVFRHADAMPRTRLVARYEIAHDRDVRQRRRACCGRHC